MTIFSASVLAEARQVPGCRQSVISDNGWIDDHHLAGWHLIECDACALLMGEWWGERAIRAAVGRLPALAANESEWCTVISSAGTRNVVWRWGLLAALL